MPALILVTLLLALFIFLAWFNSLGSDQPRRPASSSSDDGPSWFSDISSGTEWSPSEHHDVAVSDHHHCDTRDTTDHADVTEFHVQAENSCSNDDGGYDSADDGCSSDD